MATEHTDPNADGEVTVAVGPAVEAAELGVGRTLGRYAVLELLGRGGMGEVVRAYDPKLRREVALKVVRGGGRDAVEAEARLLREAQALARLSHPNVVAVFDAETTDRGVAIAMEYVEGKTLRAWLEEHARSWQEVVDMALPIASGIAAAHAAGLVHRDVKPENVLVGDDGRPRVSDFGLARGLGGTRSGSDPNPSLDVADLGGTLTRTGAIVGTPAYMAPEQYDGATPDERADQYAFCLMLWEAVHGERPFAGRDVAMLAVGKRKGPPVRPPTAIPAWLHDAMVRGLAPDPDARWPSVQALADALASGRRRGRRRRLVLAIGGALALVGSIVVVRELDRGAARAACEGEGERLIQGLERDEDLRAAIAGSTAVDAADMAERVLPRLDAYVQALQTTRTDVCLAKSNDDPAWNADAVDRALWCLDERRSDLAALLDELRSGDARAVTFAVQAVSSLAPVDPCTDVAWLARLPAPPTSDREAVQEVGEQLSRAYTLSMKGDYATALAEAERARDRAVELGWPPLSARARVIVGRVRDSSGQYEDAAAEIETAYFEAALAGVPHVAADAASNLAFTLGVHLRRSDEALQWARHAEVVLAELPDPTGILTGYRLDVLGSVYLAMGSHERAIAEYERALAAIEPTLGPDHPMVAATLHNMAIATNELGRRKEARAMFERVLAIEERAFGERHPSVAKTLNNLAVVLLDLGEMEEARDLLERTLRIRRVVLGETHPEVVSTLMNLGNVHYVLGDYERARDRFAQALEVRERSASPDHVDVARAQQALANAHMSLQQHDEARRLFEDALTTTERHVGPDSLDAALLHGSLAILAHNTEAYAEAREHGERALAILEAKKGPDDLDVAHALVDLARIAVADGRSKDAVELAERGLALRERGDASPKELADARFVLARALVADAGPSPRAISLAERARDGFRDIPGPKAEGDVRFVNAWLAEHAMPSGD